MLKETIASAFRSKGKSSMKRSELIWTLTLDLGWFSHEDAKRVIDLALERGLLVENDELRPTFDLEEVEIPIDFKPDPATIFSDRPVFDRIVQEIAEKSGKSFGEVIAMINRRQEELGNLLSVEVVALIIAKELGIDISKFIDEVEREILN